MRSGGKLFLNNILVWFALIFGSILRNINRLFNIVIKNFRILIRSKSSALIIVLGPLLIIGLIGIAFSTTTVHDVIIGVHSGEYSDLSENIISELEDGNYFIKKLDDRTACIDGVKAGDHNICLIFSEAMGVGGEVNRITFHVDYTRVNLVYAIMDDIGSKLAKTSDDLSLEMTQIIVDELENAKGVIAGKLSILNVVSEDSLDLQEKVATGYENLSKYNLTKDLGDLRYNVVEGDFDSLSDYLNGQNLSTARLDSLNTSLAEFKENLEKHLDDTSAASRHMDTVTETLESLSPSLAKNSVKVDQVKRALEGVLLGIDSIEVKDSSEIVSPISTSVQPVVTEDTHANGMFPTFLVLVLMFVSIMLASTLVLNEKSANAHFRNFVTPTNNMVFIIGTYLTSLIIVALQLLVVIGVGATFLSGSTLGNMVNAIYPLFLLASLFIFIGICVGYLFKSSETAMLAALFIVSATMFFSNMILPIESVPSYLQGFMGYNPFVLGETILKKILLFGFGLSEIGRECGILWILTIVFLIGSYLSMRLYKRGINR